MPTRRASASIEIAAPLEVVWRHVLALRAYGAWNPFIVAVRDAPDELRVGARFALEVRFRNGQRARSRERVTRLEHPDLAAASPRAVFAYAFEGPLASSGAVRAERTQTLVAIDAARTRYETEELFRGWLTFALPLAAVQEGFERHAAALRARSEAAR